MPAYSFEVDGELVLPPKTTKEEVQSWLDVVVGPRFKGARMVMWDPPTNNWIPVEEID